MTQNAPTQQGTSILFQLVWITISALCMGLIIMQTLGSYSTADEEPQLLPLVPDKVRSFGGMPTPVNIGLSISNFSEFDTIKNEFVFSGTLWFEFDPSLISLKTVKEFSFEKGEVLFLSEPTTKIIDDKLFASYDVRIKKKDNLVYTWFPFGAHRFNVIVDARTSPGVLTYTSSHDHFTIDKRAIPSGWNIQDLTVLTGYATSDISLHAQEKQLAHPRAVFTIEYALTSLRHLLTILLPMILMFYISIFSFSIDPVNYFEPIIGLCAGNVAAMLAYRFVIETVSPQVGYFMLSDAIFFLFLGVCCIIFLINTKTLEMSRRAKEITTILIHAGTLASMFFLLRWWG